MKLPARTIRFLMVGLVLGSTFVHAKESLASRLSKNIEEISRSAEPTPESERKQIFATAATTLSRHVNLQPGGISTAIYRSGKTLIHVHWQDFEFHTFQPAAVIEAERLNGVTASYRINFRAKAYRTWKSGDATWAKWQSSHYAGFSHGITVEKIKGKWVTKPDPRLKLFSPGPGTASITKPSGTSSSGLPPGMSRKK